ncbi:MULTISPECIES: hypothetical protein [Bacillus amyloliquefaciens group]|uniref:hypothetical protein n=1 Tax=Bacillus amyloliquefaciens group TaxID=1938374 RepID=UPI00059B5AC8|nr:MULTISPECIES: hypothetical protein [Bacillus amyloliquefaciens group]AUG35890.1 hypothetical protein CXP43_09185 [Bacillus velezensis]MCA1214683.1 hypothetical protein [Bacillus amyloliquefaciens]MCK6102331.1 hypothetical protein [Bacillus velezensis]MCK6203380.1 hypothetical protein [Bacillus velezensis]MCP9020042.1 hypothetical protein [Bacillus velezensis]
MRISATRAEKHQLEQYLEMMGNRSLSISQRRVARIRYDALVRELENRTIRSKQEDLAFA